MNFMGGYEITYSPIFFPLVIIPYVQQIAWNRPWLITAATNGNAVSPKTITISGWSLWTIGLFNTIVTQNAKTTNVSLYSALIDGNSNAEVYPTVWGFNEGMNDPQVYKDPHWTYNVGTELLSSLDLPYFGVANNAPKEQWTSTIISI